MEEIVIEEIYFSISFTYITDARGKSRVNAVFERRLTGRLATGIGRLLAARDAITEVPCP